MNPESSPTLTENSTDIYVPEYQRLFTQVPKASSYRDPSVAREALVPQFSWAIPNQKALVAIRSLNTPVLEIGAGTGYWSYELRRCGVNIIPTSLARDRSFYKYGKTWLPVEECSAGGAIRKYPERSLLTVWPCYDDSWTSYALSLWLRKSSAPYVIYVGEGCGGCTGDDKFHRLLHKYFAQTSYVRIPTWYGVHDALSIYRRKV